MSELTQSDRDTLRRQIEVTWVSAALAGDWESGLPILADDVAYLPPDSPPLHGKAQARDFLEAFPSLSALTETVESLWGSGDLAGCVISIDATVEGDDGPLRLQGKGLGTASKESGEWLWTAWCWNFDTAQS